jgi:hypothetical protein
MDWSLHAESIQRGIRCNDGSVEPEHRGGHAAPASPEIEAWLIEAMPSVTHLFAAAHQVTGVLFKGARATSTADGKVAGAAGTARAWLAQHPCPDTAIGEQFEAAFDDFAELAEQCAISARTIGDHRAWRYNDLDGRTARATADLMIAMSATSPDELPRPRPVGGDQGWPGRRPTYSLELGNRRI